MPKKNHKLLFNILSSKQCVDCSKRIKQRLVETKKRVTRCYKCHIESEGSRGHTMMGRKGLAPAPTFKRIKFA